MRKIPEKTEERTSCDERYIIAEKRRKIRTKEIHDSATTRKKYMKVPLERSRRRTVFLRLGH